MSFRPGYHACALISVVFFLTDCKTSKSSINKNSECNCEVLSLQFHHYIKVRVDSGNYYFDPDITSFDTIKHKTTNLPNSKIARVIKCVGLTVSKNENDIYYFDKTKSDSLNAYLFKYCKHAYKKYKLPEGVQLIQIQPEHLKIDK